MYIRNYFYCLCVLSLTARKTEKRTLIDRKALVIRSDPHITAFSQLVKVIEKKCFFNRGI